MYINVKPEEMNTVASNIENKISEWQAAVQKLYTLQQDLIQRKTAFIISLM